MNDSQDDDLVDWDPFPKDDQPVSSIPPHSLRQDVVWSNVEQAYDEGSDFDLVPLDPEVETNRMAIRESFLPVGIIREDEEDPSQKYQFSIRDMLILNAVVAVLLALMQVFAPGALAGTLGITTLFTALFIALHQPDDRRIELAWWCMLLVYIMACIIAMFR